MPILSVAKALLGVVQMVKAQYETMQEASGKCAEVLGRARQLEPTIAGLASLNYEGKQLGALSALKDAFERAVELGQKFGRKHKFMQFLEANSLDEQLDAVLRVIDRQTALGGLFLEDYGTRLGLWRDPEPLAALLAALDRSGDGKISQLEFDAFFRGGVEEAFERFQASRAIRRRVETDEAGRTIAALAEGDAGFQDAARAAGAVPLLAGTASGSAGPAPLPPEARSAALLALCRLARRNPACQRALLTVASLPRFAKRGVAGALGEGPLLGDLARLYKAAPFEEARRGVLKLLGYAAQAPQAPVRHPARPPPLREA
eukprot:tig00021728_g23303.t1